MLAALPAALLLLAAPAKNDTSADFFKGTGPVPKFKIDVDKENLAILGRDPRKYVRCTVRVEGQTYNDVGIHLKGAAGSFRGWDDRPALTLNFDKFVKGQNFRGLDKIHLNNSVQDGSYLNEILCGELSLAAGLPAARGAHALVELNGRKVGLYVVKEGFDKTFLRRHFENAGGNLYDGGFCKEIDGDLELDSGTDCERRDLKALVAACREGDPAKRFAAVDKLLDVDRFATLAALQVVAADWDGYCRNRNNYRIYFDPKTNKAVFFPHGMDQMFQNPGEGVGPGTTGLVAGALFSTPEGKARVVAKLKEMAEKHFVLEKVHKRIDELVPRVKEALDAQNKGSGGGFEGEARNHKERLRQRAEVLKREVPKLK